MTSKTISITIPFQLEESLKDEAELLGISRSRFIGNILLDWQENKFKTINDCSRNQKGFCLTHDFKCNVPQSEASSCASYRK